MEIPCFIFARKNSKGLKNKNRLLLQGKTLIHHSIQYAMNSKYVSSVVVSTDDPAIFRIAKKLKCILIYPRPKKLCTDTATTEQALDHALKFYEKKFSKIDIFAYLQVTEPLRPKGILDKCISNLIKNKKVDSSFAGFVTHKNYWINQSNNSYKLISPSKESIKPRQKKTAIIREDTGIALASRKRVFKKYKKRIGKKIIIEKYSGLKGLIDIHAQKDLQLARIISKII
jgi:CMP-N-acetylneuraminic acid synthetase